MYQLNMFLQSELCANLLFALLHSLWQGLIIAGILLLYLKSKSAQSAGKRYVASLLALSSILICLFFTWSILNYEPASTEESTVTTKPAAQVDAVAIESQNNIQPANNTEIQNSSSGFNWKPPVIGLWLTGMLVMLFRAIYIIAGGAKLQVQCDELKDERILEIVENLRKNLKINRKIRVGISEYVTVPGVIGFFSPLLLLPVSLITGVPDEALKAILAHELAHIRRYDYLVNFCQMVIEAILFFNPAVWWISRQIRIEREVCCDNAGIASIGRRIRYAEVLIQWAQKMKERDIETVEMAVAFGKKNDNSGLLERIKRIVSSDHRSGLKVSWHIAAITLVLSIATLAALWQGTNMTVAFAGNLLTPQERIDKITEISKEYGYEGNDKENVQISGVIKTWDDKPLPPRSSIMINISRSRNDMSSHIEISKEGPLSSNGTFNTKVNYGTITLLADAKGYAPVKAGPFNARPNENIENIEIVLQKGYQAKIKVSDKSGNPVESAKIIGGYPIEGSYSNSINLTTDSNGITTIEHATDIETALTIDAEGFELYKTKNLILKPDELNIIEAVNSKPTNGIVVSKTTGLPIEGANIWVLITKYIQANQTYTGHKNGEPETITDINGTFSLTKLRNDCRYLVLVEAEGYFRHYLSDLEAGTKDIKVELGPEKKIKGRITGNIEELDKDKNGTPIISHTQHFQFAHSSSLDSRKTSPVTISNGIGIFEIDECWGQKVTINAGKKRFIVNVDEDSLDDIFIDLNPKNLREVILNFNIPEGAPSIQGNIRIDYSKAEDRSMIPEWLEIIDNQARYEIPTPGKFQYRVGSQDGKNPIGYWFNKSASIDIPAGDEPYIIEVPVYPAGAIYGTVVNPDRTIVNDASISLSVVNIPEAINNSSLYNTFNTHTDMGTFNITPLPLGGAFGIIAYKDKSYGMSDIINIDENNPIVKIEIEIPKGIDIHGRVLDENNNPVRIPVTIDISLKKGELTYGCFGPEKWTDENGEFVYKNVSTGPFGECSIIAKGRNGYRPSTFEVKNLTKSVIIHLEKGLHASGVIIDEKTGWPIPGVEVSAYRTQDDNGNTKYERLEADAPTNEKGEFFFTNMSKSSYNINCSEIRTPNNCTITGGQKEQEIIRVNIYEYSDLKPRKPD